MSMHAWDDARLPPIRGLAWLLAAGPPIRPPPLRPPDMSLLYADYVDGAALRGSSAPASGTDNPQGGTVSSGEDGTARTRSVTIGVLAGTLGLVVLGE